MTHTNHASHLPSPGCPVICILADGSKVEAIRPGYITSRSDGDKGYRTPEGEIINNVMRWMYK